MALSDYGTFIVCMAYFGEPDSAVLNFLSEQYGETYTAAALTQFRKRKSIVKNSKAEYIAIRYGIEIVEKFNGGQTVKQIAQDMGISQRHVSAAIKLKGSSTEKRCTQGFLLTVHRIDLLGFISRETSCRDAAEWLEIHRQIKCSKNVVLEAMKVVKKEAKQFTDLIKDAPWILELSVVDRESLLKQMRDNLKPQNT